MSFKDLKAKRDARMNESNPSPTSVNEVNKVIPTKSEPELYSELRGSNIKVQTSSDRGRGLWATSSIRPGSRLLSVTPHIHALSTRFLDTYCSACTTETEVRRCTKCLRVSYCCTECQNNDWKLHKEECKALVRWGNASPDNATPADSIRAIGRLLWSRKIHRVDSAWWREAQAMQSNRELLSLKTQEAFTHLAQSIVRYLDIHSPAGLQEMGIDSPRSLVDLMSKFASNSFTLTSPTLDPIGVAISPLPALINHSCRPNAVIISPEVRKARQPQLAVIAISQIDPGDEIEAAYVDITLPREVRQNMLQETYNFVCRCPECTSQALDKRECMFCSTCKDGLISTREAESQVHCSKCQSTVKVANDIKDKLRVANEGLEKAESLQGTDPEQALRLATNLTALIVPFSPPSSHPRLALMRLRHSILISDMQSGNTSVDEVIRNAAQVAAGLVDLLVKGHPIRGIAMAELGKLLCVDEPAASNEANSEAAFPPRGYQRLVLAKDTLLRAREEVEIGFGLGGGVLGAAIGNLLENIDREMAVFRKGVKNLQASTSK